MPGVRRFRDYEAMRVLRKTICNVLLAVSVACSLLVSEGYGKLPINLVSQNDIARKFDDYGDLNTDDEAARLDAFAEELRQHPNLRGYIIGYNQPRKLRGSYLRRIYGDQHYLSWARGIEPSRVVVIDGGYRNEYRIELWLVPEGAPPPSPDPNISRPQINDATSYQFDLECLDCAPAVNLNLYGLRKEGLKFYADVLRNNPNLRGFLMVGARNTLNEARRARRILVRDYGIAANRIVIRIRYGVDGSNVEMWIVPRGASLPMATSNNSFNRSANSIAFIRETMLLSRFVAPG